MLNRLTAAWKVLVLRWKVFVLGLTKSLVYITGSTTIDVRPEQNDQQSFDLRSIFVDTTELQEGVRFSKEFFFIQICGTEMQRYFLLERNKHNSIQR